MERGESAVRGRRGYGGGRGCREEMRRERRVREGEKREERARGGGGNRDKGGWSREVEVYTGEGGGGATKWVQIHYKEYHI